MKYKILLSALCLPLLTTQLFAEDINLQKELKPTINNDQTEIQAYTHKNGAHVTEYRSGGKVWMIKVQPIGGFPPYYLYDDEGNGSFERRILGNEQPKAPMWIIKRF